MIEEEEGITAENCHILLSNYMEKAGISVSEISQVIGCSVPTANRILANETLPTMEFVKQVGILIEIGFEDYKKLSDADKERLSKAIGAGGGVVLGFGIIKAIVSESGNISGLSAPGITSGLAKVGPGGMLGGILTLAAVPVVTGVLGYNMVKGVKYLISQNNLRSNAIDAKWEKEKNAHRITEVPREKDEKFS